MKRLLAAVFVILMMLQAGCSGSAESENSAAISSASESEVEQSALQQSTTEVETTEPEEVETSSLSVPEADDEAPSAQSEPVSEEIQPEPAVPMSLREILPQGPAVKVDGTDVESLSADGITLIPDTALMEVYPWIQRTQDADYPGYTDRNGNIVTLNWYVTDGNNYAYPGSVAVCFSGESVEYWLPLREIAELLGLNLLWDEEWQEVFVSEPIDTSSIQLGTSIPVLMYHETSDDLWGISSLFVSPENLRQQLQYLQDNGYDPIFFSDLTHLEDYDKPVLLTCDDGYIGNYTYLYPLLKEFHMKATIFVIAGMVGEENYMTAEQIKELSDSGLVDIESHTENHYQLATLSAEEQRYQMEQSRLELARITGRVPYVLAYPNGSNNGDTRAIGPEYYTFGVLMNGGIWNIWGDWFGITRSYVNRDMDIAGFAALLG